MPKPYAVKLAPSAIEDLKEATEGMPVDYPKAWQPDL